MGIALLVLAPGCEGPTSERHSNVPTAAKSVVVGESESESGNDGKAVEASQAQVELRRAAQSATRDTIGRVFYLGRSEGYDYFVVGWNLGIKTYKVPERNAIVRQPMPYGSPPLLVGPFAEDRWLP